MVATLGLSQDLGQGEQDGQLAGKVLIERYNELMIGMRNGRILPIANLSTFCPSNLIVVNQREDVMRYVEIFLDKDLPHFFIG